MSETNSKSFGSLLVATPYESEMVQTVYSRRNGLGARLALPFQYFVQKWKQGDIFICGCQGQGLISLDVDKFKRRGTAQGMTDNASSNRTIEFGHSCSRRNHFAEMGTPYKSSTTAFLSCVQSPSIARVTLKKKRGEREMKETITNRNVITARVFICETKLRLLYLECGLVSGLLNRGTLYIFLTGINQIFFCGFAVPVKKLCLMHSKYVSAAESIYMPYGPGGQPDILQK